MGQLYFNAYWYSVPHQAAWDLADEVSYAEGKPHEDRDGKLVCPERVPKGLLQESLELLCEKHGWNWEI